MAGEMSKIKKNRHLKLLGLPKSIPVDGSAEAVPECASSALTKLSFSELKTEPEAAIEPESPTEAYAGDDEKWRIVLKRKTRLLCPSWKATARWGSLGGWRVFNDSRFL